MKTLQTWGRGRRLVVCLIGCLASACATAPVPDSLEQAETALAAPQVAELDTLQPRLVREAREARQLARQAYDRGELEQAELYGHIARNKLGVAADLVAARSAQALTARMDEAYAGLEVEAQRLGRLEQEVERADALSRKLDAMEESSNAATAAEQASWDRARRALLAARSKQALVLGAGAKAADPRYAQGRALLESALEAIEQRLYDGATTQATQADELFTALLGEETPAAQAVAAPAAAPVAVAASPVASPAASQAPAALLAAQQARADAMARGVSPAQLAAPEALLREASVAAQAGQDREGAALALAAARAFGALQAAPAAPAASASEEAPRRVSSRSREAREALWGLQQRRADALLDGLDGRCGDPFRSFEALLKLAEEQIEAGDGERAREALIRADERLKRCEAAPAVKIEAAPSKAEPAAARRDEAGRAEALKALERAQALWAPRAAREPEAPAVKQAGALIEEAQRWWRSGEFGLAGSSASAAVATLEATAKAEEPAADKKPAATAQQAVKEDKKPAEAQAAQADKKPAALTKQEQERCAQATRRAEAAQVEIKRRGDRRDAAGDRAERLVGVSTRLIERGMCEEALSVADEALVALAAPAASPAAAQQGAATQQQPTVVVVQQPSSAEVRPAEQPTKADPQATAQQGVAAQAEVKPAPADDSWRGPYATILDTLVLRDRVAAQLGQEEQAGLERAQSLLSRSRAAWEAGDYVAAGKLAEGAQQELRDAAKAAEERRASARASAASAEERARLDAAAAKQRAQEAEAAKAAEAARAAADRQRAEAEAARAAQESAQAEATEAARQAELSRVACERARCDRRDAGRADSAAVNLKAAQEAMAGKSYKRASELYGAARRDLEAALSAPLPFALDSSQSAVKLVGERLVLTPRITFESGTAIITAGSRAGLEPLVRTLLANQGSFSKLEILGFTDDRGADDKNLALSEARAQAVRRYLVESGIDASLLVARGLGEAQPVASNKTSAGRDANRRVELLLTLNADKKEAP